MKKIVRLTESDLVRLVNRVINEQYADKIGYAPKPSPQEWFKNFPCLSETIKKRGLTNNTLTVKGDFGETAILLPERPSEGDKYYDQAKEEADNHYVGKVKGKGIYYCKTYPNVGKPILQVMGIK